MSDLTEYIGARNAQLVGATTTTGSAGIGPAEIARTFLAYAIDPGLSDDARAEALEIATTAGEAALAEANRLLAREMELARRTER